MSYKEFSDIASAEATIELIKEGKITGSTARGMLIAIKNEWPGTQAAKEAERLLKYQF